MIAVPVQIFELIRIIDKLMNRFRVVSVRFQCDLSAARVFNRWNELIKRINGPLPRLIDG